jgi:hypothetical protein
MTSKIKITIENKHNQAGFFGLELLVVLLFVLFLTGAGQAIWRQTMKLGEYCFDAVSFIGYYKGYGFCSSMDSKLVSLDYKVQNLIGIAGYAEGMSQHDLLEKMNDYYNLSWVGLNAHDLKDYLNPDILSMKLSELQQSGTSKVREWEYALTQGQFGSNLFQKGDAVQGIGYMQNAAGSGDYGVMSQLQLGSIYGGGLGGVGQDLGLANHYHSKALGSLSNLSMDNSPQAQQVLASLPQAPEKIMQNLRQILARK